MTQKQAERRVHRPGQTKPVYSYMLLTERPVGDGDPHILDDVNISGYADEARRTVENRILELCQEKHQLAQSIFITAGIFLFFHWCSIADYHVKQRVWKLPETVIRPLPWMMSRNC